MPEPLTARPATAAASAGRGVRLAERPLGKLDLRGSPEDRAFMSAVGRVLDLLLPTEPCTSAGKGKVTALWQGPDRWLVTCPEPDAPLFAKLLREALTGVHAAVTEVTDGRVALQLAGPDARAVLAKGCPLDLDAGQFDPGRVAGSLLAKAEILLHCTGPDSFDLYVARSFSSYLWAWLEDAGLEYGVVVEPGA